MPNLLRFPIVLICIAIFSLWYLGSRDDAPLTSFGQQREKLVLRIEKDLGSASPRSSGKRRAAIRAKSKTVATSTPKPASVAQPTDRQITRARIVGLNPLETEPVGALAPTTQPPARQPPATPLDDPAISAAQTRPQNRTHRVVDGDDLHQLAEKYLGDRNRYLEVFEANRDKLSSPDLLPIGEELKIPSSGP